MNIYRKLAIPVLTASALVLAGCGDLGEPGGPLQPDPFPGEDARAVTATSERGDPIAEDVTVNANGSELFEVELPAGTTANDLVLFEVDENSGVESIELYDVSLGDASARLVSIEAGWFDVPGSLGSTGSAAAGLEPAQIIPIADCAGPCVALRGSDAGSVRYVRVNATGSGAEFDLHVYGADYTYEPAGFSRGTAMELEAGADSIAGAIEWSGMEQWYHADNVSSVNLSQFGDADEMVFEADVYVGTVSEVTLTQDDGFYSFGAPVNDVYVVVRSFNDSRAALGGDRRFTVYME